jgi:hypothetical protein
MNRIFTISELIKQLETFEDKNLKVVVSVDDGTTLHSLNLVGKLQGNCALISSDTLYPEQK